MPEQRPQRQHDRLDHGRKDGAAAPASRGASHKAAERKPSAPGTNRQKKHGTRKAGARAASDTNPSRGQKKRASRPASSAKRAAFDNVVLIGMPGAGKSSIGRALAKWRGMDFVDTDALIRKREGASLERIMKERGVQGLWDAEARAICALDCHNTVVSTGGSAVYRAQSMQHLRSLGVVVFLNADLSNLKARLGDLSQRGVAVRRGLTDDVDEVYKERLPLYRKFAQVTFRTHDMGVKRAAIVLSQTLDRGKRQGGRRHRHGRGKQKDSVNSANLSGGARSSGRQGRLGSGRSGQQARAGHASPSHTRRSGRSGKSGHSAGSS